MDIQKVGVIGAGQMGNGIAHVLALAGYQVTITDLNQAALDNARVVIDRNLARQVKGAKITADQKVDAMARISATLALPDLGAADLVIEAATEKEALKHSIFEALVPHLQPHTILTSNTSSISITRLARTARGPMSMLSSMIIRSNRMIWRMVLFCCRSALIWCDRLTDLSG